ncbi:MAG: DUF1573 domain-containing protein [Candidatus Marinimicrobia bacterium]|nr:DUF1573 domain-containing protein [Candidatus Neomarinimicrobiota bacterium]
MRFIKYFLTTLIVFTSLSGKNLKQVQNIGLGNIELLDIYIHENLAFVPGGLGGLNILDISDPTDVQVISEYSAYGCDYGRLYAWTVSGNYAYGTGRECGVKIIDISDPNSPQGAGDYGSQAYRYEHPSSSGNLLFLSRHQHGVEIVDISNGVPPTSLSEIETNNAWATLSENQLLYVADGSGGLRILDISSPSNPTLLSVLPTSGSARDLDKVGNYIVVAVGAAGIDLINISDPENPIFIDNYNTTGFASRVSTSGDLVAVSDWDDVEILQVSNNGLSRVGIKNNGERVMAVAMVENHIFSAEWLRFSVYEFGQVSGPDLDMESHRIEFTRTFQNQSRTESISLKNSGSEILEIVDIQSNNQDFTYTINNSSISPENSTSLTVSYSPNSGGWSETVQILSNEVSLPSQHLEILGNFPYGPMPGDPAPLFELPIVNGSGNFSLIEWVESPVLIAFFATW